VARIVFVNKEDCTSCNQCADRSPDYFQMDEKDVAESHRNGQLINQAPVELEDESRITREIADCPGECIHWQ
jgi:ferredoxin